MFSQEPIRMHKDSAEGGESEGVPETVREKKGKWKPPGLRPDPEEADRELSLTGFALGLLALTLQKGFIPEGGRYHDTLLAPYAPEVFPFLLGVSVAQADSAYRLTMKDRAFSGAASSLMSWWVMWEILQLSYNGAVTHDAQSLTPVALCAGGGILGRVLRGKVPETK